LFGLLLGVSKQQVARLGQRATEMQQLGGVSVSRLLFFNRNSTGGWYGDDTYSTLPDMRQSCFIWKQPNRRKWLGSARIVLCRKGGAGNETIPTERSRHEGNPEEGPIPTNHRAKADSLDCLQGFVGTHHGVNERNGLYVN